MQKVIPGLYQISNGANIFLLETDPGEVTIVDTGMPGSTQAILRAAAELGYDAKAIRHILVSHADLDHAGSVHGLQQATGATIYAGQESSRYLREKKSPPHKPAMNWLMGGMQHLLMKSVSVDHVLRDGEILDIGGGIEAIFAPGHTPDNYCYYWKREHVLFAPDLFFAMTGTLTLSPRMISWDMGRVQESAQRVMARTPQIICVGHGPAVDLATTPDAATMLVPS